MVTAALSVSSCGDSPTGPSDSSPRVTAITPTTGSTAGGTTVQISGANFAAGATVAIGGSAATNVVVTSPTLITAVTSAHGAGAADVVVTISGRAGTLPGGFTYVTPNTPPQITSLTARGSRKNEPERFADLGEEITLTATVTDPETPASALVYEWSAAGGVGTFTGTGATVNWRAPDAYTTPATVPITLMVKEPSAGNQVQQVVEVRVHDSRAEVGDMARRFLVAFSEQDPVAQVMQDFRDGCGAGGQGKQVETEQVIENQKRYDITSYRVDQPSTTVSFDGVSPFRARAADAWASVPVEWHSTCKIADSRCAAVGDTRVDIGIDWVTAIFHEGTNRWWLCDSDWEPRTSTAPTLYLR